MRLAKQNLTSFRNLNWWTFFLLGLLIVLSLLFLNQQPNILPSSLANYVHSLTLGFDNLSSQGVISGGGSAVWEGLYHWSSGVYESSIKQVWWLINRWLAPAVIWGVLVPTIILVLLFIISDLTHRFEKDMIANKFLSEVFKSINRKIGKAYRRSLLISWGQASLVILSMGGCLFCLQLLSAKLWRWDEGIGYSSLCLFVLYAYWFYYDQLLRHNSLKKRLLAQIDSHLGLKQGLVTLMETQNFNTSPRLYKLLLNEVFYKIKPAYLTNILHHESLRFTKRNMLIPLLLMVAISGLVSLAHSRPISQAFFSLVKGEEKLLFPLNQQPSGIGKLLEQEADSLHLLTAELQQTYGDQADMAYITGELNKLAAKFTHLAGGAPAIIQSAQDSDSLVMETSLSNKPAADYQTVSGEDDQLKTFPPRERGEGIIIPGAMAKIPASTAPGWSETSPSEERSINRPLKPSNKYYQTASAEAPSLSEHLAYDSGEPESYHSEIKGRGLRDNKTGANKGQNAQGKQKNSPPGQNPSSQAVVPQSIISALEQIGNRLSNIKLHGAGTEKDKPQSEQRPVVQSPAQGEAVNNNIRLKPIKSKYLAEKKAQGATEGMMTLEHPQQLEIDPQPRSHSGAAMVNNQGISMPAHPPANLKQRLKVNARRIEELGQRLLMINQPEGISFNPQKGEALSSIWRGASVSIKKPREINNRFPQITEHIKGVDDPRQIDTVTSELAELTREFSAWGMDAGNKLSRLMPDLTQLTKTDYLGKPVDRPLTQGGPDKADRQASIIRGKREQALQHNDDLRRLRVEEFPAHLPQHDVTSNVSLALNQVANRLGNVDVDSIKAKMNGVNLRDFVAERERRLQILNDQLAKAKEFQRVDQLTEEFADLSAQLGKFALDSLTNAKLLADQQDTPENQGLKVNTTDRQLMDRIDQEGRQLLELSQQIRQGMDAKSMKDSSSQILSLANGLKEVDFEQIMLNDYNKVQFKSLLRDLSEQLRKIDHNTSDLGDQSYAVAAMASRLSKLGAGGVNFTPLAANGVGGNMQDLASQLSNLSQQMQLVAQDSAPDQPNMLQAGENQEEEQELMKVAVDGAERLEQIGERLESAQSPEDTKRLGLELLKLSQMLRDQFSERSNRPPRIISTKAIVSLGKQIGEVAGELGANPLDYQANLDRLQQIAVKLKQRNQELIANQPIGNQHIDQLAADLSALVQKLRDMGTDSLSQPARQLNSDMYQQPIDQAAEELLATHIPNKTTPSRHQRESEQNSMPSQAIGSDAGRKRELALKNIDHTIEQLKRIYKKAETRYNPELSVKGLNLAARGMAQANKGLMDKFKDSGHTKADFTADKVAKQMGVTPRKETVSNVYPMERNLTERDVFKRIIKRLEDKRERISLFGASKRVEATASRRTGSFKQPQNIDHEGRRLTLASTGLAPTTKAQVRESTFLKEPRSYNHVENPNPYIQEFLAPVTDNPLFSALPLEKRKSKLKTPHNLKLHAVQTMDKALQHQLIPFSYRKIIKHLYSR